MMLNIRLILNKKRVAGFESLDLNIAKEEARQKALPMLIGTICTTIIFQSYNNLIRDWVEFGEIRGAL